MTRRQYEAYRDAGVDWLGAIPTYWGVTRLRHAVMRAEDKVEPSLADESTPYVGLEHVEPWTGRLLPLDDDLVPEGQSNRFHSGDVLFGKLRPYLAKAFSAEFDGLCSGEFLVMRPVRHDRRYLRYLVLTDAFVSIVDSSTYGAKMPRANWEFVGAQALPLPPMEEQRAIATFLDRETTRIDALIEKKRLLIERLDEQRTALISRTVTGGLPPEAARAAGLDPSPRFKPSGVEWLGDVPEHWKVKRLKEISPRITVGVVVNPSSYVSDEGVPFLLGRDVGEFKIDADSANRVPSEVSAGVLKKTRLSAGDVVVVRVGAPGVAAVVPPELEGANCASMMIVGRGAQAEPKWIAYGFNSRLVRSQIEQVQYGAAQKQFNIGHAVDFTFLLPPLPEQHALVKYLDEQTERIESLWSSVEDAIERLQEYRAALITAAVTGKIDVRQSTLVAASVG